MKHTHSHFSTPDLYAVVMSAELTGQLFTSYGSYHSSHVQIHRYEKYLFQNFLSSREGKYTLFFFYLTFYMNMFLLLSHKQQTQPSLTVTFYVFERFVTTD